MTGRYVVTPRRPDSEAVAVTEDESVRVVVALDRGVLVDAEPERAEELAAAGLRVKELPDPHTLRLFDYSIDTRDDVVPDLPESLQLPPPETEADGEASAADVNHLVQLVGPAQESWLSAIAERGVRLVEAVSPLAYYARSDAATVAALRDLPYVAWTGRLEPAYKVNPVLLTGLAEQKQPGLGEVEALDIGVLADGDVDAVVALVERLGG